MSITFGRDRGGQKRREIARYNVNFLWIKIKIGWKVEKSVLRAGPIMEIQYLYLDIYYMYNAAIRGPGRMVRVISFFRQENELLLDFVQKHLT